MSTKYILIGGYPHKAPDGGQAFAEELVKGFKEPVKILDCLFARPEDNWDEAFGQDKNFFTQHLPDKKLEFRMADPNKFIEQINWANAIYIRGGTTRVLVGQLNKSADWQNSLEGKTLAGSSAGANIMAKYFYGVSSLKLHKGMGFLPIKTLVHYRSDYNAPNVDWDKAENELENYKEPLEIITLAEGEFKVL